jgi:hypothetical protein
VNGRNRQQHYDTNQNNNDKQNMQMESDVVERE